MTARKKAQGKDGYAASRPTVDELIATQKQFNRVGVDFLKTDIETALTFCDMARRNTTAARKQHDRRSARRAYDAVVKLLPKVDLSAADAGQVKRNLDILKSELEALGEVF